MLSCTMNELNKMHMNEMSTQVVNISQGQNILMKTVNALTKVRQNMSLIYHMFSKPFLIKDLNGVLGMANIPPHVRMTELM